MPPHLHRHLVPLELLVDEQQVKDVGHPVARIFVHIHVIEIAELDAAPPLPGVQVDAVQDMADHLKAGLRCPNPDSIGSVDPEPDSESGSGSRRAKMTHKSRNFFSKFMF